MSRYIRNTEDPHLWKWYLLRCIYLFLESSKSATVTRAQMKGNIYLSSLTMYKITRKQHLQRTLSKKYLLLTNNEYGLSLIDLIGDNSTSDIVVKCCEMCLRSLPTSVCTRLLSLGCLRLRPRLFTV